MTKKLETKWEILFYGVLLSPLGFRAITDMIIAAMAYWSGYYFVATFFAGCGWTALYARAVERDVDVLRKQVDEKLEIVWERINGITGEDDLIEPLGGWPF